MVKSVELKKGESIQKRPTGIVFVGYIDMVMGLFGLLGLAITVISFVYWLSSYLADDTEAIGLSTVVFMVSFFLLALPLSPAYLIGRFILKLNAFTHIFHIFYSILLIPYFLAAFFIIKPYGNFCFILLIPGLLSIFSVVYLLRPKIREACIEATQLIATPNKI